MTRLAAYDLAAVAAFARGLDERASGDLGAPDALDAMLGLVRADAIEWGITDDKHRQFVELRHYPPLVTYRVGEAPLTAAASGIFWEARPACPICGPSRLRTPGAIKLSELADTSLAHPQHFQCAGIDVVHQMNLFMRPGDILSRHVFFSRAPGIDFGERDRQVLELAGIYIVQEARTLQAREDANAALVAFESGGDDRLRGLIVVDRHRRPSLVSDNAARLLQEYFGWSATARRMPAALEHWLDEGDLVARAGYRDRSALVPLRRAVGSRELTVRSVAVGPRVVVMLEERRGDPLDARSILTAREREVLDAVAEGLTNAQIADRLWVSPATVGKHLENAFAKLDVRSRAAAVVRMGRSMPRDT